MVSPRTPALRNLLGGGHLLRSLRAPAQQRRWAQVHDVRFLATTQGASRTVLEKYREKLDAKARQEGHADIGELKRAYADKIHDVRKKDALAGTIPPGLLGDEEGEDSPAATTTTTTTEKTITSSPARETPTPGPLTPEAAAAHHVKSSSSGTASASGVKPLSAILDLPKARALPVPELLAVWRLRHASDPRSLCAGVPYHTYAAMEALARRRPQFVLPVPHLEQGAEIHFLQWTFDAATGTSTVLFTQLAEYKARGEFAAPHTTVTHHLDLAAEKKIVLMQGQVLEGRGVRPEDSRWLVMCLQRFYGGWDGEGTADKERAEERRNLLEWFGTGDPRFSVEKLLEESQRLG